MATALRTDRTGAHLAWRQVWIGVTVLAVVLALTVASVIASFDATSIGSATGLSALVDNPAVRALYGMPFDLTTAAGFAVWRIGVFVALFVALWAVLVTTRIVRGEEETGRWDLLLAGPLSAGALLATHLAVLGAAALLMGVVVALTFVVEGQPVGGSALFGAGIGLVALIFVGVGAVTSQLFGQRRRAAGIGSLVIGVMFLTRMLADGSSSLGWLRWSSAFGWVEELQAFAGNRTVALIPLVVTPVVLFVAAFVLADRRDLDEGVFRDRGSARPRVRLLHSPLGFAWRQRIGGAWGWIGGLAVFGIVIGAITSAFTTFIQGDPEMTEYLSSVGYAGIGSTAGFVATVDALAAVAFALYVVSGLHLTWEDEQRDRLDLVYAAPVRRSRWFGSQVTTTAVLALATVVATGLGTWIGVALTDADLSFADAMAAALNTIPLVVLFLGIVVLLHGTLPQLGVPVGGGIVVASFLVSLIGPVVHLPDWVLSLSPPTHVALVPAEPVAWTASIVMTVIGLACALAGFVAYRRRDLR